MLFRSPTNEAVKIAESIQIEEKVTILHTVVQRTEAQDTAEVTRTGEIRTKINIDNVTLWHILTSEPPINETFEFPFILIWPLCLP